MYQLTPMLPPRSLIFYHKILIGTRFDINGSILPFEIFSTINNFKINFKKYLFEKKKCDPFC